VNQSGNSVLAHVHGFRPYFYVAAPNGFLNKDLEPLKDTINVSIM
jgi:DNA polymerase delta subunit 1